MMIRNARGQSTVEYAIIIAVVISALLVMQFWMRRGVMGKLRESTDQIGEQFNPFEAEHNLTRTFNSIRTDTGAATGSNVTAVTNESQGQTGTETLADALDSTALFP